MGPREIPLTQGKVALVDPVDFRSVMKHKWCLAPSGKWLYAATSMRVNGKRKMVRLHRFLANPGAGEMVDHKDGDGLNNTRDNLRLSTNSTNQMNRKPSSGAKSSRFKGVTWHAARSKWAAQIHVKKKHIHLGLFVTELEAADAYDKAAALHFGEFARGNLPTDA